MMAAKARRTKARGEAIPAAELTLAVVAGAAVEDVLDLVPLEVARFDC
jgi:hypothetical protein